MAKTEIKVLQQNLDKLIAQVTRTELVRRAQNVVNELQKSSPRSDGTNSFTDGVPGRTTGGRLASSWRIGFTTDHGKQVIRIFSDARNSRGDFYAGMVAKGTRAHVIAAPTGHNLAFQWISRNVFKITPQVNHPGTQPNSYITDALHKGFQRR